MRSKRWDGCCNGHLHRWTALSASVPAHSNTSRHLVGGRKGDRLMKPPGWVVSGQDLHETGDPPNCKLIREFFCFASFFFLRGRDPTKEKKSRASVSTGCRRRESPGSLVAGSIHKFSPQMNPGDPDGRRLKAFSKSRTLRGARIQSIVNPAKLSWRLGVMCRVCARFLCVLLLMCAHLILRRTGGSFPILCVFTKPDPFFCPSSPCPKKLKTSHSASPRLKPSEWSCYKN